MIWISYIPPRFWRIIDWYVTSSKTLKWSERLKFQQKKKQNGGDNFGETKALKIESKGNKFRIKPNLFKMLHFDYFDINHYKL